MKRSSPARLPLFDAPRTRAGAVCCKLAVLFVSQLFLGCGIVLFLKCRLGSDPLTVLYDGLSAALGVSYGVASACYNVTVFFLALFFARRYFGPGTVIVTFTLSFFIDGFDRLLGLVDFPALPLWQLALLVVLGQVVMSFGMALSVWADFGMNCSLAVLYRLADLTHVPFQALKVGNDVLCTLAGFLLGGVFGPGTVFSALATGAMISFFTRLFERLFFKMPAPASRAAAG